MGTKNIPTKRYVFSLFEDVPVNIKQTEEDELEDNIDNTNQISQDEDNEESNSRPSLFEDF